MQKDKKGISTTFLPTRLPYGKVALQDKLLAIGGRECRSLFVFLHVVPFVKVEVLLFTSGGAFSYERWYIC